MKMVFKELWEAVPLKSRYGLFFGIGMIIGLITTSIILSIKAAL